MSSQDYPPDPDQWELQYSDDNVKVFVKRPVEKVAEHKVGIGKFPWKEPKVGMRPDDFFPQHKPRPLPDYPYRDDWWEVWCENAKRLAEIDIEDVLAKYAEQGKELEKQRKALLDEYVKMAKETEDVLEKYCKKE